MGRLLFVNTVRTYGIFGLFVCSGAIVAGMWMAFGGAYAGLALVPLGLLCGKFCLKMATLKTELYEQGFVSRHIFGGVSGRYADLKSIARGAVRTNGVLTTNIHFVTQTGEKVTVSEEALGKDDKMAQLLNYSCKAMATTWMKILDRQKEVPWITKDSTPILKIRHDGVIVEGKMESDGFIPLSELELKAGHVLSVNVCRGDRKIVAVESAAANYFVGEMLVSMLAESRRALGATAQ
jgi:hypothetical protein